MKKRPIPDYKAAIKAMRSLGFVDGLTAKDGFDLRKGLSASQKRTVTTLWRQISPLYEITEHQDVVTGATSYTMRLAKHYAKVKVKDAPKKAAKHFRALTGIKSKAITAVFVPVLATSGKVSVTFGADGLMTVTYHALNVSQTHAVFDIKRLIQSIDYSGEEDEQVDSLIAAYREQVYELMGEYEDGDTLFRLNTPFGNVDASKYPATNSLALLCQQVAAMVNKYVSFSPVDDDGESLEINPLPLLNGISAWRKLDGFKEPPTFERIVTTVFAKSKKRPSRKKRAKRK